MVVNAAGRARWLCLTAGWEVGLTELYHCRQHLHVEMLPSTNMTCAGWWVGKDLLGHIYCMKTNQRLDLAFMPGKSSSKVLDGPHWSHPGWAVWMVCACSGLCPNPKAMLGAGLLLELPPRHLFQRVSPA